MKANDKSPFLLTDKEKTFLSDDWTWQFLKLSPHYQKEFSAACDKAGGPRRPAPGPGLSRSIKDPASVRLAGGGNNECAHEFGLAAFLDPAHETLPELKDGRSWFFPISEFEHAYFLDEYECNRTWKPLDSDSFPDRLRTPFGYLVPPLTDDIKLANPGPHMPWLISVPVDCSISPNGQLIALSMLAKSLRAPLVSVGRVTVRNRAKPTGWRVTDIADSEALSQIAPTTNSSSSSVAAAPLAHWKAVSIDVLAPIGRQILACQQELLSAHQRHHQSLDEPLWPLRFPGTIRQCPIDSYSYLKALLSLARHPATAAFNGDPVLADEISRDVGIRQESSKYVPWLDHFLSAMPLHVRRAQTLISGEHTLLVHGQITAE
ncbi:hypothetical protein [Burkholderia gladioli]|uniref:hypothetical protein n=1 Tax=Burkholderia gladioli TaxID=28095 RepID=UPI00163FA637|nr:hypothetical protein [Burkholderia gladioli]